MRLRFLKTQDVALATLVAALLSAANFAAAQQDPGFDGNISAADFHVENVDASDGTVQVPKSLRVAQFTQPIQETISAPPQDRPAPVSLAQDAITIGQSCDVCPCACASSKCECCSANPFVRKWHNSTKPWLQCTHWGYPQYFCERPFGSYAKHAYRMQIVNGLANQQVLYHYDFLPGEQSAQLSPRGVYQLEKIVRRMQIAPTPVLIQETIGDAELNTARQQNVMDALAAMSVPVVQDMVVVGRPRLPGLQGPEATIVFENLLRQTQQRGVFQGSSSGSAVFSGTTGLGGSGGGGGGGNGR